MNTQDEIKKTTFEILAFAGIKENLECDGRYWSDETLEEFCLWIKDNREMLKGMGTEVSPYMIKNPTKVLNRLLWNSGITVELKIREPDQLPMFFVNELHLASLKAETDPLRTTLANEQLIADITSQGPSTEPEKE